MKKSNKSVDDPYMNTELCIERLVENWESHNGIIIAIDFDNTIFDFYKKGYTYSKVIQLLKDCKEMGCTLILSTCCDESKFDFMRRICEKEGVQIDYINQSPPYIPYSGNKVYYNILLQYFIR